MSSKAVTFNAVAASGMSDRQLRLIRNTVATDCNNDEFELFIEIARSKGLDPFSRQILPLVFGKDKPKKRRMSIVFGIDGLRTLAARSGDYRPDPDEPAFEYDQAQKDPILNPLGIVKATVRVYKQDSRGDWYPVTGVAYWDEFAPLKDEWAYSEQHGKDRPTGKKTLDTSGQWGKMPRVMLSKCAEAQALRRAWPETVGGLYEPSELDQARAVESADVSPVTAIEKLNASDRAKVVGGRAISFVFDPQGDLSAIPLGKIHDRLVEYIRDSGVAAKLEWFAKANRDSLNQYWAEDAAGCLDIKTMIETRIAELRIVDQDAESVA